MTSLADQLPFWHFDDHLMVYKDGSLGAGFKLGGFDAQFAHNDSITNVVRQIEYMIINCDDGFEFQIVYDLQSDVKSTIDKHCLQTRQDIYAYKTVINARHRFLTSRAANNLFFVPEIYLFVRGKRAKYAKKKLFEAQGDYRKLSKDAYWKHKDKFIRQMVNVSSALDSAGLQPKQLENQEWFNLIYARLNKERYTKLGAPRLKHFSQESLNRQLTSTDMNINSDYISIGKLKYRLITLKSLPEGYSYPRMIDHLTSLPFHLTAIQTISILDQKAEKSKLELKRRLAHSMATGSGHVADIDSETKFHQIEGLLRDISAGTSKLVNMSLEVIVWDYTSDALDQKSDQILRAYRALNQAEGLIETLPLKEGFINNLPGVAKGLRTSIVKSANAAHLMPIFKSWRGNTIPVCLLPTRSGDLFSYNPFSESLPNWNGIVFGGSGSGKSFTVAQLMLMFYGSKTRPKIIWIDNGASSKNLIECLGGEFIDFKIDAGVAINMFDLPEESIAPTPEKVKLILAVLEQILKEDHLPGLPKREKALLENAIYELYEKAKGKTPKLTDLKRLLGAKKDASLHKYADILNSWTGQTAFGQILDRESNIDLSKDLVTIEVQSLNDYSELKNVIMLLLTSKINDMARNEITREYQLVIDEAERLLSGTSGKLARDFVITCYRTWRKFRSSILCLSQNYLDFMGDKDLRDSLMPNTTNLIILRQRKIDWEQFQQTFDFNDAQVSAIKSLEIVKGKYSEFYLMQDENEAILKLIPEPLSYWICTSDASDKAKIAAERRATPDLELLQILERLAIDEVSI